MTNVLNVLKSFDVFGTLDELDQIPFAKDFVQPKLWKGLCPHFSYSSDLKLIYASGFSPEKLTH